MPAFAVLEPPGYSDTSIEHADRFVFLQERFSTGAFLFGPLWLVWRRLWLELLVYLAVLAVIGYGLHALGVGSSAIALTFALIQLLIGLEATTLVRWMYFRYGWRDGGVVIADDLDQAERRFFHSRVALRAARSAPGPSPGFPAQPLGAIPAGPAPPDVVGLFPEPGGGR
jgi:hypothetical protein